MSGPKLKTAFKNARVIAPLYTSGPVAAVQNGTKIVTCIEQNALLTDVATGIEICRFAGDTESITSMCLSPSAKHLLVFTSSLSLRIFEVPTATTPLAKPVQPIRVIPRAHEAPVHVCKADPTSTYLASGSADGVVKVWDIARGYITHVFKGHGGVVSALAFDYHQDPSSVKQQHKMQLITGSIDTRIRIFELTDSESRRTGAQKPVADGKWLISGGRDSVVLVWDLSPMQQPNAKGAKGKGKALAPTLAKTVPILERVEAVGLLRPDEDLTGSSSASDKLRFYTGGENGVVKIWDAREGNVLFTLGGEQNKISDDQGNAASDSRMLSISPRPPTIISVHADQNIMFHSLSTHSLTRQLIGFNDEIVDAKFLSTAAQRDSHLALATNSSLIRVYSVSDFDARLLEGHTEIVLCVDSGVNGTVLASGSKDKSARIWAPLNSSDADAAWGYGCVGVCEGHAESVGAIALSRQAGMPDGGAASHPGFMFTGSQDRTIKMWDLSEVPLACVEDAEPVKCKSLNTLKAHEKDINALDVAPNDRLLVSGSQDRTANVYEIDCWGRARGISAGGCSATGSGDKTVKLWSLDDFTCVKTFEGHTNSVLRVDFLNMGMQLVSSGSDGLVKLWNWALAVSHDEKTVVSAAADSDCTEEQEEEKQTKRADLVLKEQDFLNYLELNDYRRAIQLAISMGQPGRLLSLFKDIRASAAESTTASTSITGNPSVDEVIRTLGGSDLAKLLGYVRTWNTGVLFAIVKLRSADDVMQAFGDEVHEAALVEGGFGGAKAGAGGTALKEMVDALIPYTERHLVRMERLVQESYMVDYVLGEMDDGMFDDEYDDGAMDIE
ncbi:U3 small nucleolar RNA-associated protein [Mycena polygramma]|nr:U3 small nucleolar RNA-associated protein [Mycena polygramma]